MSDIKQWTEKRFDGEPKDRIWIGSDWFECHWTYHDVWRLVWLSWVDLTLGFCGESRNEFIWNQPCFYTTKAWSSNLRRILESSDSCHRPSGLEFFSVTTHLKWIRSKEQLFRLHENIQDLLDLHRFLYWSFCSSWNSFLFIVMDGQLLWYSVSKWNCRQLPRWKPNSRREH